jgi:hypothetical protein
MLMVSFWSKSQLKQAEFIYSIYNTYKSSHAVCVYVCSFQQLMWENDLS